MQLLLVKNTQRGVKWPQNLQEGVTSLMSAPLLQNPTPQFTLYNRIRCPKTVSWPDFFFSFTPSGGKLKAFIWTA